LVKRLAAAEFAEDLSETVATVSGLVGLIEEETTGEITNYVAIAVGAVAAIEVLSETVSSMATKDYSDVFFYQKALM
jgi:predicted cation transporter